MEFDIGDIIVEDELEIGAIELDVVKEYPQLEDIEITPSGVEQNFKSSKYGYDNVKVKAVESDTLNVTPSEEEQEYVGLYGIVNVDKIPDEYLIPNGTLDIIDNGEYNVKSYEKANVNIEKKEDLSTELTEQDSLIATQGTTIEDIVELLESKSVDVKGTLDITENGEYNVTNYEKANVVINNPLEYVKYAPKFTSTVLPEGYELTLNLPFNIEDMEGNMADMFRACSGIKKVKLIGNIRKNKINIQYMCLNNKGLEIFDISEFNFIPSTSTGAFQSMDSLRSIVGVIDATYVKGNLMFPSTLVNISFLPNTLSVTTQFSSTYLSDASIQSIIDSLVDLTNTDTQTLMLHANVKAKLTEEQIASITSKNWNLA